MKRGNRRLVIGGLSALFRSRLRPLQALAIAVLLVVPSIGAGTANAATSAKAPPSAHVYLLRGVLNIFSLGLDDLADKLRAQGIPVTVTNYLNWPSLAAEAAAEYRSGQAKPIILVGHSSGATALPDMVARLDQLGAPVKLAIGLDSVFRTSLSGRVGRYINFYIANGNGEPVARTNQLHGQLDNVDVGKLGMAHLTIDKSDIMHRKVISAIDAAVFGGSQLATGAPKPQVDASAAKPATSAASAPKSVSSAPRPATGTVKPTTNAASAAKPATNAASAVKPATSAASAASAATARN